MRIILLLVSFGLVAVTKVLSVTDESHEPVVAIWCGKVNKFKDLTSSQWKNDADNKSTCSDDKNEILQFCKKSYPNEDVRNIVEANNQETIENWCTPGGSCNEVKSVVVYRCLVGEFEADGLMVPTGCHFLHLHNELKCQGHDAWKGEAKQKCESIKMDMGEDYGMLIPCDVDKFVGIEFVCCNSSNKVVEEDEETMPVETLDSLLTTLMNFVTPISKSMSLECDRAKFPERREKMEEKHRQRVSEAVQEWEETDKRYNILKNDDPQQASGMITDAMERFKKTITSLEDQASLERQRILEEQHECTQIDINIKKRATLKEYLEAVQEDPRNPKTIIDAVKKFVRLSQHDRFHNLRFFEHVRKDDPKKAEDMRQTLTDHLKMINERVNQTMNLLYKVPEIASHYRFILPEWAPKPAVPLEPTETAKTVEVEQETNTIPPTDNPVPSEHPEIDDYFRVYTTLKPTDEEDQPEDEHAGEKEAQKWKGPKSPTTFAAIIGLCCGALIVMIVIIVAMVVKKGRSPVTKTVLIDPECSADEEKRHLMNMQRSGYENPTYKFYDY